MSKKIISFASDFGLSGSTTGNADTPDTPDAAGSADALLDLTNTLFNNALSFSVGNDNPAAANPGPAIIIY